MDSLYHSVLEVLHVKEYVYSTYISCKCLNSFHHVLISTPIPDTDLYGLKYITNKLKAFKTYMYMYIYIYIYIMVVSKVCTHTYQKSCWSNDFPHPCPEKCPYP